MAKFVPYPAEEYALALASETTDRAYAFLQIRETICEIECEPLTPRRVEWLRLCKSPFIVGGHAGLAETVQFLWVVSSGFKPSKDARDSFFQRMMQIDIGKARTEIDEYLDRAYLDSSHKSAQSAPMVSSAAYYAHSMASEPFRMSWREVLDTPIAVIHQLVKARNESAGEIVANKRSDKVRGDWLAKQQAKELKQQKRQRRQDGIK